MIKNIFTDQCFWIDSFNATVDASDIGLSVGEFPVQIIITEIEEDTGRLVFERFFTKDTIEYSKKGKEILSVVYKYKEMTLKIYND